MLHLDFTLTDERFAPRRPRLAGAGKLLGILQDPVVLGVFVAGVAVFLGTSFLEYQMAGRLTEVETRIEAAMADSTRMAEDLRRSEELKRKQAAIVSQVATIRVLDQNRFALVRAMDLLAAAVPARTWVTTVRTVSTEPATNHIRLAISGFAPSADVLANMIVMLERTPHLTDVSLVNSATTEREGIEMVSFEMTMTTESPLDRQRPVARQVGPHARPTAPGGAAARPSTAAVPIRPNR